MLIEPVLVEREGAIATIVLNRPQARNALTAAAWRRLAAAMRGVADDETVRCVVLRGAGDRAFSAGADATEFAAVRSGSRQAREYAAVVAEALDSVLTCRHPTVALILGACEAEGLALAAACDLRVCGASSTFALLNGGLGVAFGAAELAAIHSAAGPGVMLELLLEGRALAAPEAYRRRLVSRVCPDGEAEDEACAAAARIAAGAPLAARWNKQFIARMAAGSDLTAAELEAGFACYDTHDYQAALEALRAGAKPNFRGR